MPRTTGSQTKKSVWNCKVSVDNCELHNKDYSTLNHIASDLGLTYNQVYELGPNGRIKNRPAKSFKFQPRIVISRIGSVEPEIVEEES